jgi:hypothetical protein
LTGFGILTDSTEKSEVAGLSTREARKRSGVIADNLAICGAQISSSAKIPFRTIVQPAAWQIQVVDFLNLNNQSLAKILVVGQFEFGDKGGVRPLSRQ